MSKILSFDAETNGLWGQPFAISAILREEDGSVKTLNLRCPITEAINPWVKENVIPQMKEFSETNESYDSMLKEFSEWYLENKENATIISHVAIPVESSIIRDMHDKGYIGDWDAPFPLVDICAYPEIGLSVDTYNKKQHIDSCIPDIKGASHNPLYDSIAALVAYENYKEGRVNEIVLPEKETNEVRKEQTNREEKEEWNVKSDDEEDYDER